MGYWITAHCMILNIFFWLKDERKLIRKRNWISDVDTITGFFTTHWTERFLTAWGYLRLNKDCLMSRRDASHFSRPPAAQKRRSNTLQLAVPIHGRRGAPFNVWWHWHTPLMLMMQMIGGEGRTWAEPWNRQVVLIRLESINSPCLF